MEIIIDNRYETNTVRVFGLEKQGSREIVWGFNGECMIGQELPKDGQMPKLIPLLEIRMYLFDEIIKAFIKAANDRGISSEKEDHMKGELKATKDHLHDMQQLVTQFADHLTKPKIKS